MKWPLILQGARATVGTLLEGFEEEMQLDRELLGNTKLLENIVELQRSDPNDDPHGF